MRHLSSIQTPDNSFQLKRAKICTSLVESCPWSKSEFPSGMQKCFESLSRMLLFRSEYNFGTNNGISDVRRKKIGASGFKMPKICLLRPLSEYPLERGEILTAKVSSKGFGILILRPGSEMSITNTIQGVKVTKRLILVVLCSHQSCFLAPFLPL